MVEGLRGEDGAISINKLVALKEKKKRMYVFFFFLIIKKNVCDYALRLKIIY